MLRCDGVSLAQITEHFGTPLYVYSAARIRENVRAFTSYAQDIHISYAVKANANTSLLHLIASEGIGADVVSGGELLAALKAGFAPEKISFDGPGKSADEIVVGLEQNIACFNVESLGEIQLINVLAGQRNMTAAISLRVNPDVDAKSHPYISTGMREHKFGIDIAHAREMIRQVNTLPNVRIVGIHSHIGSQITELSPYREAAESLAAFCNDLRNDGIALEHINIGGGQAVQYQNVIRHTSLQTESDTEKIPAVKDYLDTIIPILRTTGLRIILEPGRAIIADAGALITKVLYKKSNEEKTFLICDAGMTDLLRPSLYNAYHQIVPVHISSNDSEIVDIVGPVCESSDFLGLSRSIPTVCSGELLAILCTGAYGFMMTSNYNLRPKPAEVLIDAGETKVIRTRQSVQEIIQ